MSAMAGASCSMAAVARKALLRLKASSVVRGKNLKEGGKIAHCGETRRVGSLLKRRRYKLFANR